MSGSHTLVAARFEEALVRLVYGLKAKGVKVTVDLPSREELKDWVTFDYEKPREEWGKKIHDDSVWVSITSFHREQSNP
jgi:glucan biosynthesis protein